MGARLHRRYHRALWSTLLLIAAVFAAALLLVTTQPVDVEEAQYCHLVHLYQTTQGDAGWPDYAGTFETGCTPDGMVRR